MAWREGDELPILRPDHCWTARCDEPPVKVRTVGNDQVQLCADHAEIFDDFVGPLLDRMHMRALYDLPGRDIPRAG